MEIISQLAAFPVVFLASGMIVSGSTYIIKKYFRMKDRASKQIVYLSLSLIIGTIYATLLNLKGMAYIQGLGALFLTIAGASQVVYNFFKHGFDTSSDNTKSNL